MTNLSELMLSNFAAMTLFKPASHAGSSGQNDSFHTIIYLFIMSQLAIYLPKIIAWIQAVIRSRVESYVLKTEVKVPMDPAKSASILLPICINDIDNYTGQALLKYATLHTNTKHIQYINKIYVLNDYDRIDLGNDIYLQLLHTDLIESHSTKATSTQSNLTQSNLTQSNSTDSTSEQTIELSSRVRTTFELRRFLETITDQYMISIQNTLGNNRYYFNLIPMKAPSVLTSNPSHTQNAETKDYSKLPPWFVFTMKQFQTNRKFSNVFGDQVEAIRNRVLFFLNNREWYNQKGIPYTLGLLLSGPPGTGKTSCIKCLANETGRHIININMNSDITKKQIESLFFDEEIKVNHTNRPEIFRIPFDKRIYVFEDVDCQGNAVLDRHITHSDESTNSEQMDLSFLLNILDGILETPGRIVIMTSNFVERLDKALIRPGRIDIMAEFGRCSNKTLVEMVDFFLDGSLSEDYKKVLRTIPPNVFTPAEISKLLFEHMNEPMSCVIDAIRYAAENVRISAGTNALSELGENPFP